MDLIDFLLNIAGLLLWANWRAFRFDPLVKATPATLTGTLRRAEPSHFRRWHLLAGLAGLILLRAFFYHQLGPAANNWSGSLDLGLVTLFFRSDQGKLMLLFSALSFVRALVIFYCWLIVIVLINRNSAMSDPIYKMIRVQLGRVANWPIWIQALLPLLAGAVAWLASQRLLVALEVLSPAPYEQVAFQSILVGLAPYFSVKYFLPALLFLYLVSSYVYFGSNPFWDFLNVTAKNLLSPLRRFRLRTAKLDFSPLVGMILITLLLHSLPRFVLWQLEQRNLSLWPQ